MTLALKPDDVDILVEARAAGALSLALRGVNDHEVVARRPPKAHDRSRTRKAIEAGGRKAIKLEEELRNIKETLAKETLAREALAKEALAMKTAPPVVTKPSRPPRIATIYRGIQNTQRVRTDQPAVAQLEPRSPRAPCIPRRHGDPAQELIQVRRKVASSGSQMEP